MKKNATQIVEMEIENLIPAAWNYKKDGTDEEFEKLIKSIEKDGSVGVLATREIEVDGRVMFEVMDGNHRLEAAKRMKWSKVPIENFGPISKAHAVTLARRRNHNWFEDDKLALSVLMREEVLPVMPVEELLEFMPESKAELEAYQNIAEFDWVPPEEKGKSGKGDLEEGFKFINLKVPEETYNLWIKWKDRLNELTGNESEARAFEFAVIEAMNIPEEKLHEADLSDL